MRRPTAHLSYEEVRERGMDAEAIASRANKEIAALQSLHATIATVSDLSALHAFLFTRHGAYRARTAEGDVERAQERAKGALAGTY